jgi:ferric citrate transport system permease protein
MSTVTATVPTAAAPSRYRAARRRRHWITVSVLVLLCLATTFVSLMVGATVASPMTVAKALVGVGGHYETFVFTTFQLPRVLLCWAAGVGLAVSGGVMQGVIRNPLAAPDIVGVTKGAGLAAVIVVLIFPQAPTVLLPVAAFAGGVLAFGVVYLAAYRHGTTPARLALVGVAVSFLAQSGILFFLIRYPTNVNQAFVWLAGSLYGRTMGSFWQILPWVVVLVPLLLAYAHRLDTLGLGDDMAAGLGETVERTRRITLFLAVALASAVVAGAGTIAFVGLIAPHIARRLVGGRHRTYLPVAALIGVILMLGADTIGRGAAPPLELPAGLVTSLIGAPYFLYLLAKTSKSGAR